MGITPLPPMPIVPMESPKHTTGIMGVAKMGIPSTETTIIPIGIHIRPRSFQKIKKRRASYDIRRNLQNPSRTEPLPILNARTECSVPVVLKSPFSFPSSFWLS
jgi:hypothetical protein